MIFYISIQNVMLPGLSGGLDGEVTLIRTKSFPEELRGIFAPVLAALLGAMGSSVGDVKCRLPFSTSRKVNTADLKSSQSPNVICKTCQYHIVSSNYMSNSKFNKFMTFMLNFYQFEVCEITRHKYASTNVIFSNCLLIHGNLT